MTCFVRFYNVHIFCLLVLYSPRAHTPTSNMVLTNATGLSYPSTNNFELIPRNSKSAVDRSFVWISVNERMRERMNPSGSLPCLSLKTKSVINLTSCRKMVEPTTNNQCLLQACSRFFNGLTVLIFVGLVFSRTGLCDWIHLSGDDPACPRSMCLTYTNAVYPSH